ncbi:flagellar biosynthesis anti-sigma factor FlgM [Calditerrivibrio nitroreducens]|uniref:Negative regulator of flagellin synthesis n=1 Tax=Calditerrivibrio nitroreducens (strain DSM 19672 / NBRC 101217 / Yu37-1) TaxID=768670 RepID=E4TJH1_CALNY|nr:flagellar biosynthesis anti-sigma factor FlgM [Calditerrivibrio nitroreducens]ADR18133.1 Anti-sigma-28 factor FlgM family protein [Calditerrivibrio nitroreducens DSM 19672]
MRVDEKYISQYDKISNMKKNSSENTKSGDGLKEKSSSVAKSQVSSLIDRVKSTPDVRKEIVDQIRNQIEAGTYTISGKKVAEKIVGAAINNLF